MSVGSVEAEKSTRNAGQQLQCYACGLPKVHPEFDVVGSYGRKIYNHSCEEMINTITDGKVDEKFVRTCPVGVKSCFGATGFYDHEDTDPENDIWIRFWAAPKPNTCMNTDVIEICRKSVSKIKMIGEFR